MSAGHCLIDRSVATIGLVVGEHDVKKGSETAYTVLIRISSYTIHPRFNKITNANDIALIKPQIPMRFTRGVQPACLPFKFKSETFFDKMVQGLGW